MQGAQTLHRGRGTTIAGFTAVELLVVIGVMMLLMGMAAPGVLKAMRRGAINSAANGITQCWRQARMLALTRTMPDSPDGAQPKHYGVAVVQRSGERAYAAVIYDNRDAAAIAGAPARSLLRRDPLGPTDNDALNPPVVKLPFNRNVAVAVAKTSAATVAMGDQVVVVYAQYRTGLPIAPGDVACGHASTAAAIGVGLPGNARLQLPDSPVCATLRLQTLDFSDGAAGAARRGHAVGVTLYPVGVVAAQEL